MVNYLSCLQSNQKKFIEYIASNNVEKISKLINKGLDPNLHCPDSGGIYHNIHTVVILLSSLFCNPYQIDLHPDLDPRIQIYITDPDPTYR